MQPQIASCNAPFVPLCQLLEPLTPLAPYLGGTHVVPGVFHAVDAFASSERAFKRHRKARLLGASAADDALRTAFAHNAVGVRRLRRAIDSFDAVIEAYDERVAPQLNTCSTREWNTIVSEEILPVVVERLLESSMSSGELSLWTSGKRAFTDAKSWSHAAIRADLANVPALAGKLLEQRRQLSDASKAQLAAIPLRAVPIWKAIATEIVKIAVRVAIAACKTWNFVVSKIIEIVWSFIDVWFVNVIFGWCHDGSPSPVQP